MSENTIVEKAPFIGWVEFKKPNTEPYGDLGVYIVNPTDETYDKVELFTGMYEGDTDGLTESSKVVRNLGTLMPHSSMKLDSMTWYDLDYHFWYHLDFYRRWCDKKPLHYSWFEVGFYDWKEEKIELLPVLNTRGMKITLDPREEVPITEEAKNTHMEARYTPTKE